MFCGGSCPVLSLGIEVCLRRRWAPERRGVGLIACCLHCRWFRFRGALPCLCLLFSALRTVPFCLRSLCRPVRLRLTLGLAFLSGLFSLTVPRWRGPLRFVIGLPLLRWCPCLGLRIGCSGLGLPLLAVCAGQVGAYILLALLTFLP